MIGLLVFHDGRNDYLRQTLTSLRKNVFPVMPNESLIVNDSLDIEGIEIAKEYGIKTAINTGGGKGIFRAVEIAWEYARKNWQSEFIWHQENDFTYNEQIDTNRMLEVLRNEHVMQVALKRQAWYPNEIKRGGFMECNPKAFVNYNINGIDVVTHREFFTNNPSIYRLKNMPEQYGSEYTIRTHLASIDPRWTCTYLGRRQDDPKVHHIGEIKV